MGIIWTYQVGNNIVILYNYSKFHVDTFNIYWKYTVSDRQIDSIITILVRKPKSK